MKLGNLNLRKVFSSHIMMRAVQAFDRNTTVVVASCWAAAFVLMLFALYAIDLSGKAKREAAAAETAEPSLPKIITQKLAEKDLQPLTERLQKRFPDVTFLIDRDKALTISELDVSKFRQWLTVLSYIDTAAPQYRWTLKEFCVGAKCGTNVPMRAVLTAESVTFAAPDLK